MGRGIRHVDAVHSYLSEAGLHHCVMILLVLKLGVKMKVTSTKKVSLQWQGQLAGVPLDSVVDHAESVQRILPALNLAELLALRKQWTALLS